MQKLDTKAIIVLAVGPFISFTILSFIVLIVVTGIELLIAILIGIILGLLFAVMRYRTYGYRLDENGYTYMHGFSKTIDSISYTDIKNVKIKRGILGRALGLSYVTIYVDPNYFEKHPNSRSFAIGLEGAGSELPGLKKDIAEQLRTNLMGQAHINTTGVSKSTDASN